MWVADYLSKFKHFVSTGGALLEAVSREVKTSVGIELHHNQISIREGVARLSGLAAAERSAIYLKKRALLEALNKQGVKLRDIM